MKHILNFYFSGGPLLTFREQEEVTEEHIKGNIHFRFSDMRACTGYRTEETYLPCPNNCINCRQCPSCSYRDVSRVYTVGDFSQHPKMYEKLKQETYCIYLAAFGADIIKAGLTRKERLPDRWLEQGADMAVSILEFDGPDKAYPAERLLHDHFDFRNAVQTRTKIKKLAEDAPKDAKNNLEEAISQIKSSGFFSNASLGAHIADLSPRYPKWDNPSEEFELAEGEMEGCKGQLLFFRDADGRQKFVNMRSKISSFII
jgi:hypothetical protein